MQESAAPDIILVESELKIAHVMNEVCPRNTFSVLPDFNPCILFWKKKNEFPKKKIFEIKIKTLMSCQKMRKVIASNLW